MTKENIEKISVPFAFFDIEEISADEKKRLIDFLSDKGFSSTTFYLRFFQKGFAQWEIIGVNECKRQFLAISEIAQLLLKYVDSDAEKENRGYLYTLALNNEAGSFYNSLKRVNNGLCMKFIDFMQQRGMSTGTVIKRFSSDNWKPWEVDGITNLLCQYNEKQSAS